MENILWMAVTNDKFEFPIFIENSSSILSKKIGLTNNGHIFNIINRQKGIYKKLNLKIIKLSL